MTIIVLSDVTDEVIVIVVCIGGDVGNFGVSGA